VRSLSANVVDSMQQPQSKVAPLMWGAAAVVGAAWGICKWLQHRPRTAAPKYKLVACDMDGTLLNQHHKISDRNVCGDTPLRHLPQLVSCYHPCSSRLSPSTCPCCMFLYPEQAAVLRKLHQLGVHVVLCSGRMLAALEPFEHALGIDMNLVCYNGAVSMGTKWVPCLYQSLRYHRRDLVESCVGAGVLADHSTFVDHFLLRL